VCRRLVLKYPLRRHFATLAKVRHSVEWVFPSGNLRIPPIIVEWQDLHLAVASDSHSLQQVKASGVAILVPQRSKAPGVSNSLGISVHPSRCKFVEGQ
jgi:hypothetical protein